MFIHKLRLVVCQIFPPIRFQRMGYRKIVKKNQSETSAPMIYMGMEQPFNQVCRIRTISKKKLFIYLLYLLRDPRRSWTWTRDKQMPSHFKIFETSRIN